MSGRLAGGRGRAPFAAAALALAAFAAVGVAVLDDYGVPADEDTQRLIGQAAVNYVLPGAADLPADRAIHDPDYGPVLEPYDRYYGVAFEAPLVLAERLLGLTDSRAVFLTRHLLTHLFFLAGGWILSLGIIFQKAQSSISTAVLASISSSDSFLVINCIFPLISS